MPHLLPAVLIGGPPNSGKSVLSYSLAKALRQRRIDHYLYRACPDGEGDWFQEGPEEVAKEIRLRVKGSWTRAYAEMAYRQIERRPFPWLVDSGGLPGPLNEPIFRACTHAILLTPSDEAHTFWQALVERHGLVLLADLRSDLEGVSRLETDQPIIRGTLAGLRRSHLATGEVIEALADRLAALFTSYDPEELRQLRLTQAPVETTLELDRYSLDAPSSAEKYWRPEELPDLVTGLPSQAPLALYGRAPNWVYGAIAAATTPAPLALFDVRLGWLNVPTLHLDPEAETYGIHAASGLAWRLQSDGERAVLEMSTLPDATELDYEQIGACLLPAIPPGQGLICSGRLPQWLWTGLARCYHHLPWLALYQLQTGGAVIISSRDGYHRIGARLDFTPST
jgi:CRISPR-associated protein Csx3